MKAIILCAGLGTRLLPLTEILPKPLFPIVGSRVIDIILDNLKSIGINQFGINLHHKADMIREYLKPSHPQERQIQYSEREFYFSYEPVVLETGGGLALFRDFIVDRETRREEEKVNHNFIVHNCDIISDIDMEVLIRFHIQRKALVTLLLVDPPHRKPQESIIPRKGGVLLDSFHRVVDIGGMLGVDHQRGMRNLHGGGIFVYSNEIFDYLPVKAEPYSVIPIILNLIKEQPHRVWGYYPETDYYWKDMGNIPSYIEIHRDILIHKKTHPPTVSSHQGGIHIAEGVRIPEKISIEGFLSVEKSATLGEDIYLEDCVVWENAIITPKTHLTHAIITPQLPVQTYKGQG